MAGMPSLTPIRVLLCSLILAGAAAAQTPQPFPRQPARPAPAPPAAPPALAPAAAPAPTPAPTLTQAAPASPAPDPAAPTAAQLGIFIPASAQFVASYDVGRGQRYYIFGTAASFADVVAAYRNSLKEKGTVVFEQPPTHLFEVGKFREDTMGFPPGVTVKDYTSGGSAGYPNPNRGAQPERYATLIQVVPPPPAVSQGKR